MYKYVQIDETEVAKVDENGNIIYQYGVPVIDYTYMGVSMWIPLAKYLPNIISICLSIVFLLADCICLIIFARPYLAINYGKLQEEFAGIKDNKEKRKQQKLSNKMQRLSDEYLKTQDELNKLNGEGKSE
ncbi:MAG TPA: hypothetical protein H9690_00965 [Firmicutes bacterium]|nr:hypothetical protein [Bacillota bacterium]